MVPREYRRAGYWRAGYRRAEQRKLPGEAHYPAAYAARLASNLTLLGSPDSYISFAKNARRVPSAVRATSNVVAEEAMKA